MEQHFEMIQYMIKKACDSIDICIIKDHIDKFLRQHKDEFGGDDLHMQLNASWIQKKTELKIPVVTG